MQRESSKINGSRCFSFFFRFIHFSCFWYKNMLYATSDLTQNLTDYDCLSCGYNKLPSGAINAND